MQVTYKVGTAPSYVPAASGLAWKQVTAVHAQLEFEAVRGALTKNDTEGTDNKVLTRSLDDYILLRNRSEEHTAELQSLMRISYAVFCLQKHNKTMQQNKN